MAPSIPPHAVCLKCGYSLRGLSERRCPECGFPFDPGDWRTYARREEPSGPHHFYNGRLVVGALLAALLAWVSVWLAMTAMFP